MNGIEKLTGWATVDLKEAAYVGVGVMIEHYDEIDRIAERFCLGSRPHALADIFEKGLQAMLDMCDMDDHVCQIEEGYTAVPFTDTEVKAWEDARKEDKE